MTCTEHNMHKELVITGPALRTRPESAMVDIPAHWQAFMAAGGAQGPIYAVYCEYASDWGGDYTLIIGSEVTASAPLQAGHKRVVIPVGRYARFEANGDPSQVIWKAWVHINSEWEMRDQRRYAADFERYASNAAAEILIGLR